LRARLGTRCARLSAARATAALLPAPRLGFRVLPPSPIPSPTDPMPGGPRTACAGLGGYLCPIASITACVLYVLAMSHLSQRVFSMSLLCMCVCLSPPMARPAYVSPPLPKPRVVLDFSIFPASLSSVHVPSCLHSSHHLSQHARAHTRTYTHAHTCTHMLLSLPLTRIHTHRHTNTQRQTHYIRVLVCGSLDKHTKWVYLCAAADL